MAVHFPFDNSYSRLPDRFYTRTPPTPVRAPKLISLNRNLALDLGLQPEYLASADGVAVLAGNRVPENADAIATAYAGHQFGHFVPQLGDGRAILLGEVVDRFGNRRDIQLKGAGRTPFSRGGDGRAAVGPVLREYIVSEAMFALGVPTTRSLAAVSTGEDVLRETVLPGAVLTRVAASHVRVGTFQFFAARGDAEAVRILADHVIDRHYPHAAREDRPYRALLNAVIAAQAHLLARWMQLGFIHGVMNTDNMSVAGETIDYGPCAFMDEYHPDMVFSSIDSAGRYRFSNQPGIAEWNLARFAECLIPLLHDNVDVAVAEANDALRLFGPQFTEAWEAGMHAKLGFFTRDAQDAALRGDLFQLMTDNGADFTLTFRRLSGAAKEEDGFVELFINKEDARAWVQRWRARIAQEHADAASRSEAMKKVNPAYIPRNHRVEAVIAAAVSDGDFGPFEEMLTVMSRPYEDQPEFEHYQQPPLQHERVTQTFCGT